MRQTPQSISIIRPIASPEPFDGEAVRVIGFVSLEFEATGIFLSELDCFHSIPKNGLWLDLDPTKFSRELNHRYALVEGTFDATHRGHLGMWSGCIREITRLDLLKTSCDKPNQPARYESFVGQNKNAL
jgi:hypothetical protein